MSRPQVRGKHRRITQRARRAASVSPLCVHCDRQATSTDGQRCPAHDAPWALRPWVGGLCGQHGAYPSPGCVGCPPADHPLQTAEVERATRHRAAS